MMKLLIFTIFACYTLSTSFRLHSPIRFGINKLLIKNIFQTHAEKQVTPTNVQGLTIPPTADNKLAEIRGVLSTVIDPETSRSIIESGKVLKVQVNDQNDVIISIKSKSIRSTLSEQIKQYIQLELCAIEWIGKIDVNFVVETSSSPSAVSSVLDLGVGKVKHVIAVSSGKGGVGKSTVAVNLAYSFSQQGYKVGILDADIYGPSLPTMTRPVINESNMITQQGINPLTYNGVKLMSMGFINKGAAIMRGPMVNQILNQLVTLTRWGELDYLILDLPPGTGDVQLTLSQIMNITTAVIVTTPQKLSFVDVVKGIDLFDTVNIPCIAVVENMAEYEYNTDSISETLQQRLTQQISNTLTSTYNSLLSSTLSSEELQVGLKEAISSAISSTITKSAESNKPLKLFGKGNNQRLREMWGIENIISLPIVEDLARCSDQGTPYVLQHPSDIRITNPFQQLTRIIADYITQSASASNSYSTSNIAFDDSNRIISLLSSSTSEPIAKRTIPYRKLRSACRCAVCVEEFTGKKLLKDETIPESIKPINMAMIGRYAVSFDWSDGHKSLYPFKSLIQLAEE